MHGVTRTVELPFALVGPVGPPSDPASKKLQLGVAAEAQLDRDAFGITWRHQDPLFVGREVTVRIRLLTRLTDPSPQTPAQAPKPPSWSSAAPG